MKQQIEQVEPMSSITQTIDGVSYQLKSAYDLSWIATFGTVFQIFDDQDSGNLCFGVKRNNHRFFLKFAGAPTKEYSGSIEDAIARLKATVLIYQTLTHPTLIHYLASMEIGGGFVMVFDWVEGLCLGKQYPEPRRQFLSLSLQTKLDVFLAILQFHTYVHEQGYVAIDFYDGSVLYDRVHQRCVICDIDFYTKLPYINERGRLWGSSRFMSPEEYQLGATIDQITNVYGMGAMAFALFAEGKRDVEAWPLDHSLYQVAYKAVSANRVERQQSIDQLMKEWRAAISN